MAKESWSPFAKKYESVKEIKIFYSSKVINKLRKIINPTIKDYQNIDCKLACFYETD